MPNSALRDPVRGALPTEHQCEVLVIGSGPAGASAAYWLAEAGVDVVAVERKHFPREKTCGDGLTPRSVRQLADMGVESELSSHHRYQGLRAIAFGKELDLSWPSHPDYPNYGYVITRFDLDALVAERADKAGATIWQGAEALSPLGSTASNGGPALGAVIKDRDYGGTCEVSARYVLIADGANSRIGRALGTTRNKSLPQGMALRGYYASPRHDETFIESHLDIKDKDGEVVPGYGWIFPVGDGRVNVGVGLLSTSDRWRQVNTSKLMDDFVAGAPASWCLGPDTQLGAPTGGRLPMGLALHPRVGPDYLLAGDAAGAINPFNGEGIAYGYETGRLAAEHLIAALASGDDASLSSYEQALVDRYGLYYKAAAGFVRIMSRPELMRRLVTTGMYSRTLMEWLLRIMANLLRPDEIGPAELAWRAIARHASRPN